MDFFGKSVDWNDHEEVDGDGDNEEGYKSIQEVTVEKLAAVDRENERGKIGLLHDRRNERREQVLYERRDDSIEGRADDHADRKVYYASPQDEFLESFEHGVILTHVLQKVESRT